MSEATGRQEMERRLVQRSLEDDAFRRRLLDDPKGVVEEELGTRLSEGVQVQAVEESADTIYLVLPPRAETEHSSGEISDEALQDVAGGEYQDPFFTADASCILADGGDERGVTRPQY